jgi:hypothetical protein
MTKKTKLTRSRSTISGRFVTKAATRRSPRTTVTEKVGGGSTGGAYRSAITGKFVSKSHGKRHPNTTMRDS